MKKILFLLMLLMANGMVAQTKQGYLLLRTNNGSSLALKDADIDHITLQVAPPDLTTYQPLQFDMTITPATPFIDFATYDQPYVQLFEQEQLPLQVTCFLMARHVSISDGKGNRYDLGDGNSVSTAVLQSGVQSLFGKKQEELEVTLTVTDEISVNGYPEIYTGTTTFKCLLPKSEYPEFLHFIGATNGWSSANQKLAMTDKEGSYSGFCYIADPNGWGLDFKFQTMPDNWDNEINADSFNSFTGNAAASGNGNNLTVNGASGVYYMEVDLSAGILNAVKVEVMSIIGDFNGWADDVDMTWDPDNYCFTATHVGATANGWKFRINHDWSINLGGTLDQLVNMGDNLMVDADRIQLYPTRRDSDHIYCTVNK